MIEKGEEFLLNLYIKSKKNLRGGIDINILQQMMGLEQNEARDIVYYLKGDGYVETSLGYGNTISLQNPGIDFAKEYLESRDYKIIKFSSAQHIPMSDVAAEGYIFSYDLVDKNEQIEKKSIKVLASDLLIIKWQLNFSPQSGIGNAEKLLLQIAKEKLNEKIKEGSLQDFESYMATTSTTAEAVPYNLRFLPSTRSAEFVVFYGETIEEEIIAHVGSTQNMLAVSIIEFRDQINAVFNEKFGSKLLLLNEERAIINLFKVSGERAEFTYNLISLAEMARRLNIQILRTLTNITDTQIGSVQLLKTFATQRGNSNLKIVGFLQTLGNLRQGYPSHGDNARVIQAHTFFGYSYPIFIGEFSSANIKLLELYKEGLAELFDFIYELPKN